LLKKELKLRMELKVSSDAKVIRMTPPLSVQLLRILARISSLLFKIPKLESTTAL
jgi:hypothetical protein